MKCLVCGSDETELVEVVFHTSTGDNEITGYEDYACKTCRSHSEYGIKIIEYEYTDKNDVIPYEIE